MEEYQAFRVADTTTGVRNIGVDNVDGQNVIYWEDIEQVFPGVQHVQNGKFVVKLLRDSNRTRSASSTCLERVKKNDHAEQLPYVIHLPARITPHCIKHCPGIVLDVVLSTSVEHVHVDSPMATPSLTPTDLASIIIPESSASSNKSVDQSSIKNEVSRDLDPAEPLHFSPSQKSTMQIPKDTKIMMDAMISGNRTEKPLDSSTVHAFVEGYLPAEHSKSMATHVAAKPGLESTVLDKLDGLHDQGYITQEILKEVWKETQEIKDRSILIQCKTKAILTQNYELLEYTIPRLFIVLPETSMAWNPATMFRTKFRLHFICECGEHTKAAGSEIPHHLHLANHEGYVINKPTEFFEKYGPFLMVMLEIIKLGTGIAGFVVPALANLKVVNTLDFSQSTINSVTSKVIKGVDYSLRYLEESRTFNKTSVDIDFDGKARALRRDLGSYLSGVEGLEGVDLRQLGSYLAAKSSDNLLGNLYRMTTKDGHVKWVCRDHYRAGYQEKHTQKLRDVVKLAGGEFDEQLGKIKITLESSFAAAELYDAINEAKGVLDLDMKLHWNQEYADFVKLKDMISKSNIKSIIVNLNHFRGPNFNIKLPGRRRYDPIFEIMRLPSIQSFGIEGVPKDFFKRLSTWPADFSNLRHLAIGQLDSDTDIVKLKLLVTQVPNLSSLSLETPQKLFEGSSPWPSKTNFSNLGQLAIGRLDSDTDIVKLKLLVTQAPNLSSLSLETPKGFFERCSPWPRNADFSNLRHLAIGRSDSDADIVNLMQLVAQASNLSSLSLETSKGFFERCSPWPRNADLSNLRNLSIGGLDLDADIVKLKLLVAQAPNLSILALDVSLSRIPAVFSSIAECQTYPIIFPSRSLRVWPPRCELRLPEADVQDLMRLLEVHGVQLETLVVRYFWWDDSTMEVLIEARQSDSSSKEPSVVRQLGDNGVKDPDGVIAQSELRRLEIHLGEEGDVIQDCSHVRIPESILWNHIRELYIEERRANPGVEMKALVDSMEKMLERVELEELSYNARDIPAVQWELLGRIVSLLSLKSLDLLVRLTCEQVHALFKLMDISRLQYFVLWDDEWDSGKVQTVLDALQHATQLRTIYLLRAEFTEEQKEQMHAKGIKLRS
ncbi:hypothetical protein BGX26_002441 [Mortierella sp. AD094]|nr:hypothetical protein BGX26_002441 [Mortierella sp. AD094]